MYIQDESQALPEATPPKRWALLAGCLLLCQGAGLIGAFEVQQPDIMSWYAALAKPPINPPNWVFGPVWTLLYALMGISLWLMLRHAPGSAFKGQGRKALALFVIQLALNAAWMPIFAGLRSIGGALADIALLLLAIWLTIAAFRRINKPAAWLLLPYAAWVSFALVLNGWLWLLNR